MPETVKRPYRSSVREAAAAETRHRIRAAAAGLFTSQGYAATTLRQIASAAGVGERTLYDAFPTKAALFAHTLGVAIVGDEEPATFAERPWLREALEHTDPVETLRLLAANTATLMDRAGDLIMVSIQAAGADPDMRATADAGAEATYQVQQTIAENLHHRGALRTGLDAPTAADILYLLTAPHTHQVLCRHRGWSIDRYQQWIHDAMTRELLP
ncbi:TetR/AcrR family transcriptional regulator [Nocardia nepalensis]|uniref:TetR/AcrR family transcriptional regulator n=1 Tax=Nocardia nepalensis TaxID=3375448 RepID=UPI003B67F8AA